MKKIKGFTLIELLVVIFIISIASAAILLTNSNGHNFKSTRHFVDQLHSQIQIIHEQSISQMKVLGLLINTGNYEFFYRLEGKDVQWIPLRNIDSYWKQFVIPSFVKWDLHTSASEKQPGPQILFSPNGEMTEFILTITSQGSNKTLQLIGNKNGHSRLVEPK